MSNTEREHIESKEREAAAAEQHSMIGACYGKGTSSHTMHPAAQWFERAGLGLFIHWGISSVHGGIDISWSMIKDTPWDLAAGGENKLSPDKYWELAKRFDPQGFDPEKWLSEAKKAGFTYAIFTAKHHDGYTMWPSRYSTFGTHTHMGGRDLVKEYVEACRRSGLKVGLYFSVPDWHINREYMPFNYVRSFVHAASKEERDKLAGTEVLDWHWEGNALKAMPEDHLQFYRISAKNQIIELIGNYGKIDMIWFDGGDYELISLEEILKFNPGILVNRRMLSNGDFDTRECSFAEEKIKGWWECLQIWNFNNWGYQKPEGYNTTAWAVSFLARVRSWNGTLVLNSAPRPSGEMPESFYDRMDELGHWMEKNREAIYDVTGGPHPEICSLPVTVKDNLWYVFFIDGSTAVKIKKAETPRKAYLLDSRKAVSFLQKYGELEITLPNEEMNTPCPILVIEWQQYYGAG